MSQLQSCQEVILLPLSAEEETDGERTVTLPWGVALLAHLGPEPLPGNHSRPHRCSIGPASPQHQARIAKRAHARGLQASLRGSFRQFSKRSVVDRVIVSASLRQGHRDHKAVAAGSSFP